MQQQVQFDGADRQLGGHDVGVVIMVCCVVCDCRRTFVYSIKLRVVRAIRGPCVRFVSVVSGDSCAPQPVHKQFRFAI